MVNAGSSSVGFAQFQQSGRRVFAVVHRSILATCAAPDGVAAVTAAGSLSYTKHQLTDTVMAVTTLYEGGGVVRG